MTPLRVLVAEDDDDHRYLTIRALRQIVDATVEIHEARDGEETLDHLFRRGTRAGALPPHVVFLDLRMPKTSGFEILERVKSDPDLAAIPIVVVTSSQQPEDVDAAYALGTNSYVSKATGRRLPDNLARVAEYWTTRTELPGVAS